MAESRATIRSAVFIWALLLDDGGWCTCYGCYSIFDKNLFSVDKALMNVDGLVRMECFVSLDSTIIFVSREPTVSLLIFL